MHKPLMSTDNNNAKIKRLERFFEIYKLGSETFPIEKSEMLKLHDHKGGLFVVWNNIPFDYERTLVKMAWEMQNEYEVMHQLLNEQPI